MGVHVLFIIYKIAYLTHFSSFLSFGRPFTNFAQYYFCFV